MTNTHLYAVWDETKVNVKFDPNGGQFSDSMGPKRYTIPYGGSLLNSIKLENPTRVQHDFIGWFNTDGDELLDNFNIFVTHDMGTVKNFCSRVYWLDGGRIRQVGRPIDIVEQYLAAMLGRDNAPKKLPAAIKAAENTGDGSAGGAFQLVDVNKSAICNGEGGARITGVGLFDSSGNLLQLIAQSCPVVLRFSFVMEKDAESLHCAFQVLDKQGVAVIGSSNSILEKSIGPVRAGEMKTVSFSFTFPELANNDYVVLLAVNEGDIDRNVRLQNIVNAYTFKFHSSSLLQRQFVLFKLTDCKVRLV